MGVVAPMLLHSAPRFRYTEIAKKHVITRHTSCPTETRLWPSSARGCMQQAISSTVQSNPPTSSPTHRTLTQPLLSPMASAPVSVKPSHVSWVAADGSQRGAALEPPAAAAAGSRALSSGPTLQPQPPGGGARGRGPDRMQAAAGTSYTCHVRHATPPSQCMLLRLLKSGGALAHHIRAHTAALDDFMCSSVLERACLIAIWPLAQTASPQALHSMVQAPQALPHPIRAPPSPPSILQGSRSPMCKEVVVCGVRQNTISSAPSHAP
jgi:hypothetical protein